MSGNFWEMQRQIAYSEMVQNGVAMGNARVARKEQEKLLKEKQAAEARIQHYETEAEEIARRIAQRQQRTEDLVREAEEIRQKAAEREKKREAERLWKARYDAAIAQAKETGQLPEEFQRMVPEDRLASEAGMLVVALRELEKLSPSHPMVHSQQMRDYVSLHTTRNYTRAGRPEGADFADFAPGEEVVQRGLQAFKK